MAARIQFVTGRLAERSLRGVLASLAVELGIEPVVDVLPITVAALMTPQWIAQHIGKMDGVDRIIVPGYCSGGLESIQEATGKPVERGPRDLRGLPEFLGGTRRQPDYGQYSIEIIAEINLCPRLTLEEIVRQGERLAAAGADVIDVGCEPGSEWPAVADAVRALRDQGLRVSIDSLNPNEIASAVQAGAELVLSVNRSNRHAAADWGCEVVVIPEDPHTLDGLDETVDLLAKAGVPLRLDPILEPIGFGFAASLQRYAEVRRRYPDAEMMMGIGNL
ncbi:MAG: dihydropteroate synthase, partial [Planctomycetales bacterium]|nr:dihydropteroate synthase [Planctomycetales bacterium]